MEAVEFRSAEQHAKYMARYITDASTIRAHCLNNWGKGPTIREIEAMQLKHRLPANYVEAPIDVEAENERLGQVLALKDLEIDLLRRRISELCISNTNLREGSKGFGVTVPPFTEAALIRSVASDFGVTSNDICGRGRTTELVHARGVIAKILRMLGRSYPQIGKALGDRDHSTVINLISKFDTYLKTSDVVRLSFETHCEGKGLPSRG